MGVKSDKIDRGALFAALEALKPGLRPDEMVAQENCYVFRGGTIYTYNELVACRCPSPLPDLEAAVPAEPLRVQLGKFTEDELSVYRKDNELVLRGGRKSTHISVEAEILLAYKNVDRPKEWSPLHKDFLEAVKMVGECPVYDKTKSEYHHVVLRPRCVEVSDSCHQLRYDAPAPVEGPLLLRRDALRHVVTLGATKFALTSSWAHFRNPEKFVLSCRRGEGLHVIDLEPRWRMTGGVPVMFPKSLAGALDRAETFAAENKDAVYIKVEVRPGEVKVTGRGVSGRHEETKPLKYDGKSFSFLTKPSLLRGLIAGHDAFEVGDGWVRAAGAKYKYMARTWLEKVTSV